MIYQLLTSIAITTITDPFPHVNSSSSTISILLNVLFAIVGALTLLFIVIGGFKYVVSGGNPQAVSRAKDTILYAVIGLTITVAASVIVNFVLGNL